MKEIVVRVDDAAFERLMGMLSLCPSVEVVEVNESAVLSSGPLAIRIRHAIVQLREERLLRRMYDYAWLKVAMDSDDDLPSFESAQKYIDYLGGELQKQHREAFFQPDEG